MRLTLGLDRLGIALLALSAFGTCNTSPAAAQSEMQVTRGTDAPVAVDIRAGPFGRSATDQRTSAAHFISPRSSSISPARLLVRAREQHAAMPVLLPAGVTSLAGAWKAIGPAQVVSPNFGNITGRVSSVAIDPSDASGNTVYAGTTGGGVWKSMNAAASASQVLFVPLMDDLTVFSPGTPVNASISIGAVSVQPGGTGVLLAGTGDPNDALDSYYGSGLLRSEDRGLTWTVVQKSSDSLFGPSWNFSFVGEGFAGFAWSTISPNFVVAAVAEAVEGTIVDAPEHGVSVPGLYYSTDAGATWRLATITDGPHKLIQGPNNVGWIGSSATAVVWNPIRKMFYAAVRLHGYYGSPDGITWTRLANQPGTQLTSVNCPITVPVLAGSPNCPIFRGALAAQPITGDLFAFTVDKNDKDIGLWQDVCTLQSGACASSTVTFSKQISTLALEAAGAGHVIAQGTYNLWLAAIPTQADTLLYTGTVDISRCSLANGCMWRNTTNSTSTTCSGARVSPSQHAVDFLPGKAGQVFPGLMFFGNDGGLWRTTDGAQQPSPGCSASDAQSFDNLNASIGSLAEIGGLAQHPTDSTVFLAGLGANGTAAPSLGGTAWPQVLGGEGATTAIDPVNPQNWYTTSGPGVSINRCAIGSACTPADFAPAVGETQVGGDGLTMPVPAAFLLDAKDPSQMLVGTCRVWLGPANGASWSASNAISNMLDGMPEPACKGNALVRSLAAIPDPTGEWIYAGMAGLLDGGASTTGRVAGHIFRAHWAGSATAWTDLTFSPVVNTQNQPFNGGSFAVSSIVADPHDTTGKTIYVVIEGFAANQSVASVHQTTDAGAHWTNVHSNLPSAPANGLVVDPQDSNTIYVALDTGVYVTRNISSCSNPLINCWSVYGTALPQSPVTQLRVFGGSGGGSGTMLRAGTYGRGIWEIALASSQSTGTTATVAPTSVAFSDQPVQTTSVAQALLLTNTGTQPLLVTGVVSGGDFAQQNSCSTAIAAQGTCRILVTFTPTQLGAGSGSLTISANIPSGQLIVALSGNGIKGANIVLLPTSLDFGIVPTATSSAIQYMTISNIGGTTIAIGATSVSGPFRLAANTCGGSLAPTYGCTVGIAFAPTASGLVAGSFSVTDDVGTQTASLSGIGETPPSDSLAPLALTFAPQVIATNSLPQLVTLTNEGDAALSLIRAQALGDFSVTNNCGASLAGHSSCVFSIVFHPSIAGQQTGTLVVSDQIANHTVTLSGTGLAPAGISIAPASVDFGGVGVGGSSAQNVTLTNNGGVLLDGIVISVTGDFAIAASGCTTSLAPGTGCAIQVLFSPSQAGARTGNLTVTSSSATSFNVPVNGYGEDFELVVAGSASATVVTGQTAGFSLSLIPIAGSSGTVSLTCTGAPTNSICTVSPASAQITGGNTVSISVHVATGQPQTTTRNVPPPAHFGFAAATGLLSLALLIPVGWRSRRLHLGWLAVLLMAVAISPLGCGVSVSGGKLSTPSGAAPVNATPPGTYAIIITAASQGIQKTATLSLTVE